MWARAEPREDADARARREPAAAPPAVERLLWLQSTAGNAAVASRLARRPTLARKVEWEDLFFETDEPPEGEDAGQWVDYQKARQGYEQGDQALRGTPLGSLLDVFENEPNVLLAISSDPKINPRHLGETSMEWRIGTQKADVGKNTASAWMPLVRAGAQAVIEVAISYGENAGTVMHTVNHELAMHATKFLELARWARAHTDAADEEVDEHAHALVGAYHVHHAESRDPNSRYNRTQEQLLKQNPNERDELIHAHAGDYDLYDDTGRDIPLRAGHGPREYWLLTLSASSPVMALAIGEARYILWKKHRVKVARTAAETYKVAFTWSITPYNVKVGALIPGSVQGSDENTFVAPAPVHGA